MRLHQRLVSIFGGIRKAVASHLDEQAINAACREEKYTWRERLFNPTNTVHLFILQILNRNTALNDLPRKSHESYTGSAFCKARQRLAFAEAAVAGRDTKHRHLSERARLGR